MAKNIVIKKDGVSTTYNGVKKLHTNSTGGSATWVPLDETELAVKTISKNGKYKASSDGYYGYRSVTVTAQDGAVGTKPDGRTYAVQTDNDGYLTETLLPDNIKITTPPTKMAYHEGESIDVTGMVVKAYSKSDVWSSSGYSGGVIPSEELSINPSVAGAGSTDINVTWERPVDSKVLKATFTTAVLED